MPKTRRYKARHSRPSPVSAAAARTRIAALPVTATGAFAVAAITGSPAIPHYAAGAQLDSWSQAAAVSAPREHETIVVYTVQPGDTLTGIAAAMCGNPADWTGIYLANQGQIADPQDIQPGWRLKLGCLTAALPQAPAVQDAGATAPQGPYYNGAPGTFEACVITAESGGNPDAWNATGHWGLYQFAYSTWVAAGGDPALFGNASAAYQHAVFEKAYALWGTSPWAPSDGC